MTLATDTLKDRLLASIGATHDDAVSLVIDRLMPEVEAMIDETFSQALVVVSCEPRLANAQATIARVRALRDDWNTRGHMSSAVELTAALDGGE